MILEPSPRLYRKERANKTAVESNDEKSEMEDKEEAESIEKEEGEAPETIAKPKIEPLIK